MSVWTWHHNMSLCTAYGSLFLPGAPTTATSADSMDELRERRKSQVERLCQATANSHHRYRQTETASPIKVARHSQLVTVARVPQIIQKLAQSGPVWGGSR